MDESGSPVEGVNVHDIFHFDDSPFEKISGNGLTVQKSTAKVLSALINFSLAKEGKVKISIFRRVTRELMMVLVDDTLQSGTHSFSFDTHKFTNGFYLYQIKTETEVIEKRMTFIDLDIEHLIVADALTKSSNKMVHLTCRMRYLVLTFPLYKLIRKERSSERLTFYQQFKLFCTSRVITH